MVDNGSKGQKKNRYKGKTGEDDEDHGGTGNRKKPGRKAPVCLLPPQKAKGYRHYLKDCSACPEDEKRLYQGHR